MNIVYIITKADEIGGAQIHVRDLSIAMKKLGHTVTVIVGESGALTEQLHAQKISFIIEKMLVRNISPLKDLICLVKLRSLLKRLSPDVVTLHSSKAGIIGRASLIGTGIPCVFTAHGWAFADGVSERRKKMYILVEKFFSNFCKKIITVSEQDKKLALKYNVASDNKQVVIHNGISDPSIDSSSFKNTNNTVSIISVARFSSQKDHASLLKALSMVNFSNWTLNLIGKGPLESNIRSLAEELKLNDKVAFLGERNDVINLLSLADIFVLPSNWEGLPISIIEAMSLSLPIIASDVGGVNEMVFPTNGFLIPRGNAEIMAQALNELVESKETRIAMGKSSREIYCECFNFQQMLDKTYNVYVEVSR